MELIPYKEVSNISYPTGCDMHISVNYISLIAPIIKRFIKATDKINIWVTGSSGAILSGVLYTFLRRQYKHIKICHVKKEGEHSHNSNPFFFNGINGDNVINIVLDDFISTGISMKRIYAKMSSLNQKKVDILAVADASLNSFSTIPFEPDVFISDKRTICWLQEHISTLEFVGRKWNVEEEIKF